MNLSPWKQTKTINLKNEHLTIVQMTYQIITQSRQTLNSLTFSFSFLLLKKTGPKVRKKIKIIKCYQA